MEQIHGNEEVRRSEHRFGHRTGSTLEAVKTGLADKLESAANALHPDISHADAVSDYRRLSEDWLRTAADYVRRTDLERLNADLKTEIRKNPGRSLAIAGAAGLVVGLLFRRR